MAMSSQKIMVEGNKPVSSSDENIKGRAVVDEVKQLWSTIVKNCHARGTLCPRPSGHRGKTLLDSGMKLALDFQQT